LFAVDLHRRFGELALHPMDTDVDVDLVVTTLYLFCFFPGPLQ